jgi:FkbM family methyltransferase
LATEDDILACFRLLLGRTINPEERVGHLSMAGQELSTVLPIYLQSLEFAQRNLLSGSDISSIHYKELDGFGIFASSEDSGVGRHVLGGQYELNVCSVFRRFIRPGMGVIGIGANIGYFTMLSAALVGPSGSVLAIEPNPANAKLIEASRRANGFENITIAQVGAGRETSLLVLNAGQSNGTTSSALSPEFANLWASTTVPCVTVDSLMLNRPPVGFLKIDVEGAEYNALVGASQLIARDRPLIVSEFSPGQLVGISGVDGEHYLRWLIEMGYNLGVIDINGNVDEMGGDWGAVMTAYHSGGVDHIDIVATPLP